MDEMKTLVELKDELKLVVTRGLQLVDRDDVEGSCNLLPRALELIREINRRNPGTFDETRIQQGERLYAKGQEILAERRQA